jgi:FdhD protein
MYQEMPCIKVNGEQAACGMHEVIVEKPLSLFVNGRAVLTAVTSPSMIEEFVTGYLYTERIIRSSDDIESIQVRNMDVRVITKDLVSTLGPKKTVLSGCGGSGSFLDFSGLPEIQSDFSVPRDEIPAMVKVALESELHVKTGGIHVVGLVTGGKLAVAVEDIGRHNALDKVVGSAIIHKMDLSRSYIIISGRISSEMVRKCLVANIPVIVSRGATTTYALEIAEKKGLSVIGFVRSTKMVIYTHPSRITGVPGSCIPEKKG